MKIGVLSDAHGVTSAFNRAVILLKNLGAERTYFIGDAVGYVPSIGVLEQLYKMEMPSISGNHELALLTKNYKNRDDHIYQLGLTDELLTPELRSWASSWPNRLDFSLDTYQITMVHGSPDNPSDGYIYPDSNLSTINTGNADVVFMGHTHRPFIRKEKDVLFVNVGSCALPRDGAGWGAVAVFDSNDGQAEIYRFCIKDCIMSLGNDLFPPHEDVLALAQRELKGQLVGKIVDDHAEITKR